jgi:S1-C subfamily serine protease
MNNSSRFLFGLILAVAAWASPSPARAADPSFAEVFREVNPKMAKVFGAGGFRGITAYCTGVLISPDGYILTVYSPTLDSRGLRVHLYDGTRHEAELVAAEPLLDVALIRIKNAEKQGLTDLPHFELGKKPPEVQPGDWVLAFSNLFEIAVGDEPVSVQHGVIAAIAPFAGRRGIHESAYKGNAYILDAVTNNPGSHGGVITTRKGELVGLIGKELRNTLTQTWVNYAMPIKDLTDFVNKAKSGEYKPIAKPEEVKPIENPGWHGIALVPDVIDRTPPYIENLLPDSPAAKAGLKPDDLIVFMHVPAEPGSPDSDERLVPSCRAFKDIMAGVPSGANIKVVVRRGVQLLSFDFKLEQPPKVSVPKS